MVWNEAVVERRGHRLQACELLAAHFRLLFGEDFRVEGLFELEQMPEDARQLMRHGRDRLGTAQSRFPAAIQVPEVVLGLPQALRRQAQRLGGAAF